MDTQEEPIVAYLAQRLRRGPPSIDLLVSCLQGSEAYAEFIDLIREYLPDYEREILAETDEWGRIARFVSRFADRYFPLDEGLEEYEHLTMAIPVIVEGISYDDYHEMPSSWRPGYCLMTYLVESPYYDGDEARIALAEECLAYVNADLLRRMPQGGFSPQGLGELTEESRYQALGHWARILWHDTGNRFLDIDYEELWSWGQPEWDRETVEDLTREWQQAERIQQVVHELAQWLEEDPSGHFEEIINFLEEKMNE